MVSSVAGAIALAGVCLWLLIRLPAGTGVWRQGRPLSRMLDNSYEW
jgi:hypothetical protein